jgi:predicted NUDIX family NTP pyrophosphohydrolase
MMYRWKQGRLEVFLAHPGGPFFAHKDDGHWSIPKGEIEPGEDYLETAMREFGEETGQAVDPKSRFIDLGLIQQKGGKIVHAWAFEGDWDESRPVQSNLHTLEWPAGSGRKLTFPEVDRAQFFSLAEARAKLKERQTPFLSRLEAALRTKS